MKDDKITKDEEKNGGQNDATSVTVTAQETDSDYIDIAAEMCNKDGNAISDNALAVNGVTYVKVSAKLKQILTVDVEESTSIAVTVTAEPDNSNT